MSTYFVSVPSLIFSFSVWISVSFSLFFQSLSTISFVSPLAVTVCIYNPLHHHFHLHSVSFFDSFSFSSFHSFHQFHPFPSLLIAHLSRFHQFDSYSVPVLPRGV